MDRNIGSIAGDTVLGQQEVDVFQKLRSGVIPYESMEVFRMLSRAQHQLLAERKDPFAIPADPREVWENIYGDAGVTLDLTGLDFTPPKGDEEYWPIVVAKGMTIQNSWNLCSKLFRCEKRDSLDKDVPTNDRTANETYIIWVRANIEADSEFANMSANDLQKKGHKSNTFMERILLEAYYFTSTGGKHLDLKNWTMCAGSRDSSGRVPRAEWYGGQFQIFWCYPGYSSSHLCSRSVVSA